MRIVYKIYNDWKTSQIKILSQFNIKVEVGYDSFEIEEGDIYFQLKKYFNEWGVSEFYGTEYNEKEISSSKILIYNGSWSNGYPQPEDDFGYIGTTYKKESYCKNCGTGLVQQEPFRIKKEPNWGTKKMFELNWIFDEIFVRKEIYEQVFRKYDVDYKEVLQYKKETIIENIVQLILPTSKSKINIENQPFETCNSCGIKKYSLQIKGFFPSLIENDNPFQIFKSQEYFGSGANAHKKIFITQKLRQELLLQKVKSQFIPVSN
jgi:hypothetical protein